ncbi:NYN domain-containing protein [Brevundimonas diminuta]|uniref:NYN domain-containing protein n=1 Tax=Brevundimonas diminuta TaxID=293 RepID=UPI003D9A12BA
MAVDTGQESSPRLDSLHLPDGQDSSDKGLFTDSVAAPFSSQALYKVGWYVDGFNLYHALDALRDPTLKWLNLRSLAESYLKPTQQLERVVFSTAYNTWDAGKRSRHLMYVKALETAGVDVIPSKFDKVRKYCRKEERYCDFNEEKQSDVNLAVEALADVYDGRVNTVFFLTADSDQIPTFRAISRRFPDVRIYLVAPPGRLQRARELAQHAHSKFELTEGKVREHPLDDEYRTVGGTLIAARPQEYAA